MEHNFKRNFLWNTAGSLIYFFAQWVFTILVWRVSSGEAAFENAGLLTLATTITNVFLSIASYGMYNYHVSDIKNKYSNTVYIKSRDITCFAAVILCIVYTLATGSLGAAYSVFQVACIMFMLGFRMVESKTDVYNAIYQRGERLDIVGKTYAARGIISLVCFVAVLYFTQNMAATLFVMLLVNVLFFFAYTKRNIKGFYNKEKVGSGYNAVFALLIECAPLAVYSFLNTTTTSIPRIVLERMHGSELLGTYGSVTAPVLLLQVGATYLFTPFITMFAKNYADKNKDGFYRAIKYVLLIIGALLPLGILVAVFIGPFGLRVFVSEELVQYSYLLSPMVVSAVLTALVLFFSMVLTVMRQMKQLIICNVLAIALSLAVSVPLINMFNMQGVTLACVAALSVQCAAQAVFVVLGARKHFSQGKTGVDA